MVGAWAALNRQALDADWDVARRQQPLAAIPPLDEHPAMLEVAAVEPSGHLSVRITLTNGAVVERDLSALLQGPLYDRIAASEARFREVDVAYGTLAWPGGVDIAPETLIWDGPTPADETSRTPFPTLRPSRP